MAPFPRSRCKEIGIPRAFRQGSVAESRAEASTRFAVRAISVIYGGLTLATVMGAPLGVFFGSRFGWRLTFLGVAVLAVLTAGTIRWMLARQAAARTVSFAERLAVARRRDIQEEANGSGDLKAQLRQGGLHPILERRGRERGGIALGVLLLEVAHRDDAHG